MESLEIVSEKHVPWLSEQIEWIRFGWNIVFVSEQCIDVASLIIKTTSRLFLLHYQNRILKPIMMQIKKLYLYLRSLQ